MSNILGNAFINMHGINEFMGIFNSQIKKGSVKKWHLTYL